MVKEISKQRMTMSQVVDQAQNRLSHNQEPISESQDMPDTPPSRCGTEKMDRKAILGNLLRTAAALSETMDSYRESQLMTKYLHAQPPLHPRRTLDQYYYRALKCTGTRDRDQVIYRETTPEQHECDGPWTCAQCKDDVRKVPRIVMVDQLWLWILDESMPCWSLESQICQSQRRTNRRTRNHHHKFPSTMG